jgi:ABC-type uncharacterized transport system involved in gliding motility auxiliary subunit
MKVSKSGTVAGLIVAVVVAVVFANLLSLRHFTRIDLTQDGKYTLAEGSKKTMQHLDDVMVVTAYFTEGMPTPYASYARYVRDMLEEYRSVSNGKLAFEFIDPLKEESEDDKLKKKESVQDVFGSVVRAPTSIESELMELGVTPVEIRVVEDDQLQTKRAYMGLVIRYQGKKEVIPVVEDFANFEKELTVLMRKITRHKAPVIAIVNDLQAASIARIRQLIAQSADIVDLAPSELKTVPAQVDAVLVMGTGNLGEDALKALDTFVVSGKNAAFFIDQQEFDPQALKVHPAGHKTSTKLAEMLQVYGVTIGAGLVADVRCREILMQEQREGMVFGAPVKYPFFPVVTSLDQESPVTHGLGGAIFPFATPVSLANVQNLKGALLAQSSEKSWLEQEPYNTDPNRKWQPQEIQMSGPHGLVAEVRGVLASHFGAGGANKASRLLVVGTSAVLWDAYLTQENQAFAMASVDYLLADDVMLSMHTRVFSDLPIDPDVSDSKRNLVKYGNMLGIPALLAFYGCVRWRRRESRRRKITLDSIG